MSFRPVEQLRVSLALETGTRPVGRLALVQRRLLFEYDPSFLASPLPISPFYLAPRTGVFEEHRRVFDGLFGLFHDSLPDGWGRLLLDREMDRLGVGRERLGPLDRLAWVGARGWGALVYEPAHEVDAPPTLVDLVALAAESKAVLEGSAREVFPMLLALGGSSGGARPKVLLGYRESDDTLRAGRATLPKGYVPVLVKFASREDPADIGAVELAYNRMASLAGLLVARSWLLGAAGRHRGYFATERFDRPGRARVHAHSLSGLVHAHHAVPSTDYESLLRVTRLLTRDQRAVERVYRQMVFNVVAHNRDDHARNFAFLMDPDGTWRPSPAYDLTFSPGPGGEHWMTVAGEGGQPTRTHLIEVARRADVPAPTAAQVIDEVREAVSRWDAVARDVGVGPASRRRVKEALRRTLAATA